MGKRFLLPLVLGFNYLSFAADFVTVGPSSIVFSGANQNQVITKGFPTYSNLSGAAFVTDGTFLTSRNADGTIAISNGAWSNIFRWPQTHLGDEKLPADPMGPVTQSPKEALMMPYRSAYDFVGSNGSIDLVKNSANWHWYIPNTYKISERELLGFVHLENVIGCGIDPVILSKYEKSSAYDPKVFAGYDCGPWFSWSPDLGHHYGYHGIYSIGLAYSNDKGITWRWLGEIIKPFVNKTVYSNIGGVPYIVKKGVQDEFYVYYNETKENCLNVDGTLIPGCIDANRYVSVAAAPLDEVIQAARSGRVTPWKKYQKTKSQWVDALTSFGDPIFADYWPTLRFDAHTDAATIRNGSKSLYMIALPTNIYGLSLLFSDDGLNFPALNLTLSANNIKPGVVVGDVAGVGSVGKWIQYVTIIGKTNDGISTDDFHEVGPEFYLLYPDQTIRNLWVTCRNHDSDYEPVRYSSANANNQVFCKYTTSSSYCYEPKDPATGACFMNPEIGNNKVNYFPTVDGIPYFTTREAVSSNNKSKECRFLPAYRESGKNVCLSQVEFVTGPQSYVWDENTGDATIPVDIRRVPITVSW